MPQFQIKDKLSWAQAQRARHEPTIPSTIDEEKSFNPFMRTREPPVQAHTGKNDPIATMNALRSEKDYFKAK